MTNQNKNNDLQDQAKDSQHEVISALMDGETQPLEVKRLLSSMAEDESLRKRWARMQVASNVLNKQAHAVHLDNTLADRVSAALAEEGVATPSPNASIQSLANKRTQRWQALGGFAVAASVTMVLVLGGKHLSETTQPTLPAMPEQTGQSIVLAEPEPPANRFQAVSIGSGKKVDSINVLEGNIIEITDNAQSILQEKSWSIEGVPDDFRLLQHGSLDVSDLSDVKQDVLIYGNGETEFTLFIELLGERTIAEGAAFSGNNLVLGRELMLNGETHFVTLKGNIALALANQVVNSITTRH